MKKQKSFPKLMDFLSDPKDLRMYGSKWTFGCFFFPKHIVLKLLIFLYLCNTIEPALNHNQTVVMSLINFVVIYTMEVAPILSCF